MKIYIVDASVILKWVLGDEKEPDYVKAIALLTLWVEGGAELRSPSLWKYEVGNFLGRNLPEEAGDKMNLLLNLNIGDLELNKGIYMQCFSWMKKNKVSFYDACYLAAAFAVNGTLITADQKFVNKMGKTRHVCLLKNLDLESSVDKN
jgi:predicted nucleic acid-binding protein